MSLRHPVWEGHWLMSVHDHHGCARRRVACVGAAVCAAVVATVFAATAAVSQVAPDDELGPGRPGSWRGTGNALGARVYFNMEPRALPVDDMLTIHVPDVSTLWDSTGDARARASSVFPGQTVVGLPDLLATFGVPMINEILPPYPATTFASPTARDTTSTDGTSRARVGADLEYIEAIGTAAAPGVTDALAPFVEVEPGFARSRQHFEEQALVSRSESRIGSVRVVGGLVEVDGVHVAAEARATEVGEPETSTAVTVGAVSIAGTRVGVTAEGIIVGGMVIPPGGLPDTVRPSGLAGRVNEIVTAFGLEIQLLGGSEVVEGRAARAIAGGLLVKAAFPLDGPRLPTIPLDQLPVNPNDLLAGVLPLPVPDADPNVVYRTYLIETVIGQVSAEAVADVEGDFGSGEFGGEEVGPGDVVPPTPLSGGQGVAGDLPLGPSDIALPSPGASPAADARGAPVDATVPGASSQESGLVLIGASVAGRMELLSGLLLLFSVLSVAAVRLITAPIRGGS